MSKVKQQIIKELDVIVVGMVMLAIFSYIMFVIRYNADLIMHADGALDKLEKHALFSNNFLMHFMANLLTLFSGSFVALQGALVVLISLSNTAKYALVRNAFEAFGTRKEARLASGALLFVYIIPVLYFLKVFGIFLNTNTMYLGYSVPNIWHNSTILCMMPFAIVAYLLSVKQLNEGYEKKRNGLISLFVVIGALIKPSFFFVYAVAYPILAWSKYRFRKEFFYSLIPVLLGGLCVVYEFVSLYDPSQAVEVSDNSGVVVDVLALFTLEFWKSRLLKLTISLAFPFLFVLGYRKTVVKEREFWLVFIMLVVAFGISWCCHETGPRASHGNFDWQVICSMWFVYFYMLKTILTSDVVMATDTGKCTLNNRGKAFVSLYGVHVLMGLYYLLRFLITKDYG